MQKGSGITSGFPVAVDRSVPNGMKDFSRPVCDMLEKNAHLCSVLNAPLPNSLVRVPRNRLPLANRHPVAPNVSERRITGGSRLPQLPQQYCRTFSNGAQTYCDVNAILPVTVPGNRPAAGAYCNSSIPVHGCRPPVNGMLVSYADTRNGYCTNTAGPGMMIGQPCRQYGPMGHFSVAPMTSTVNSEFVCKMNGVADVTASSAPRTNTNTSSLQFSAVMVSDDDWFVLNGRNCSLNSSINVCVCIIGGQLEPDSKNVFSWKDNLPFDC